MQTGKMLWNYGIIQYSYLLGIPESDTSLTISGGFADSKVVGDQLKQITQQIEDIQYIPIEILTFSNNINIAEMGSTVNEITLTWKLNKVPASATLNSLAISGTLKAEQTVTIRDGIKGSITANEAGIDYDSIAKFLIEKGVRFAYSLDGGGSCETVLRNRQLNPIFDGSTGRKVPTVIYFSAD